MNINVNNPDVNGPPALSGTMNQLGLIAGGNQRFSTAGNERIMLSLAAGSAYQVNSSDQWAADL